MVSLYEEISCQHCGTKFSSDTLFRKHLRQSNLRIADYYSIYCKRFDLLTKEPIPFKDKTSYFVTDFLSKDNLQIWFQTVPKEQVQDYIKSFIIRRKEIKKIRYIPTQVELRSLCAPSIGTILKYLPDYFEYCLSIGLESRFQPCDGTDVSSDTIICDTREQLRLSFNKIENLCLKFGDYALKGNENYAIERKSVPDFLSSFSSGIKRITKEIQKAQEAKGYLIVMVEDLLGNVLDYKNKCRVSSKINIPIECIFHNIRKLLQEFPALQFLFVKNRPEMQRLILKILSSPDYQSQDLQLLYDQGKL